MRHHLHIIRILPSNYFLSSCSVQIFRVFFSAVTFEIVRAVPWLCNCTGMGLFMWDCSGRCWSTSPGRCAVCLAEVPSWPGALWLQQSCFGFRIIHSAFPEALWSQALCSPKGAQLWISLVPIWLRTWGVYTRHHVDLARISSSSPWSNPNPSGVKRWFPICVISLSIRTW